MAPTTSISILSLQLTEAKYFDDTNPVVKRVDPIKANLFVLVKIFFIIFNLKIYLIFIIIYNYL